MMVPTKRASKWLLVLLALPVALTIAVFVSARLPPPQQVPGPVKNIRDGAIQGAIVGNVAVYRGVPFAAAPVHELRWRAPTPVTPWTGVRRATEFKPACMQKGAPIPGMAPGPISEDCLYLNIWTPAVPPVVKLPVMVFLHGGGGINGSASARAYWGDELARRGVITVNLSYRLGMFGWLAHPDLTREADYHTSGNYAVLDMIAGLRWVRDNIVVFGGDPDNVTLFGHSAGAFYASRLMSSPLAAGLFHKVIGQSGGDFQPAGSSGGNTYLAAAERTGVEFASSLEATSIDELRRVPAERLIHARMPDSQTRLPIVDGYVALADNHELYRQRKQREIPLLLGYNAVEGAALEDSDAATTPVTAVAFRSRVQKSYGEFAPRILEKYPARTDEEASHSFTRLRGEEAINWNTVTWARLHAASGAGDVYVYYFSKHPPFGPLRKLGAAHGAELPYVFGFVPKWMRLFTQWPRNAHQDMQLAAQIPSYWVNFARTGNPNAPGLPRWPVFDGTQRALQFGDTATAVVPLPHQDEHALFDAYFDALRAREPPPGTLGPDAVRTGTDPGTVQKLPQR